MKLLRKGERAPEQPFAICGDDLAGIFTPQYYAEYEMMVRKYNGKFS